MTVLCYDYLEFGEPGHSHLACYVVEGVAQLCLTSALGVAEVSWLRASPESARLSSSFEQFVCNI